MLLYLTLVCTKMVLVKITKLHIESQCELPGCQHKDTYVRTHEAVRDSVYTGSSKILKCDAICLHCANSDVIENTYF